MKRRDFVSTVAAGAGSTIALGAGVVTEVLHIGHDGACESDAALRARLVERYGLGEDLVSTRAQREATAYRLHLSKVAYRKPVESG